MVKNLIPNQVYRHPLVLLDRDGVINQQQSQQYICKPEQWHALPGSLEALAALKQAGYQIAIVTNQSGIARGYFTYDALDAMHNKLKEQLAPYQVTIDAVFVCPHHPDDGCYCRKPAVGLLQQALRHFNRKPQETLMIGDSVSDIQAAISMGIRPMLVLTGHGQITQHTLAKQQLSVESYFNLQQAVAQLL